MNKSFVTPKNKYPRYFICIRDNVDIGNKAIYKVNKGNTEFHSWSGWVNLGNIEHHLNNRVKEGSFKEIEESEAALIL